MGEDRELAGIRWAVTWLHKRAAEMNDPWAKALLNTAAFNMGCDAKRRNGEVVTADEVDWNAIVEAVKNPPPPNEALKALFADYKAAVLEESKP